MVPRNTQINSSAAQSHSVLVFSILTSHQRLCQSESLATPTLHLHAADSLSLSFKIWRTNYL